MVFNYVEEHKADFLEMLKKSITFKSLPGQEEGIAKWLLEELQKLPVDEAFIDEAGNVVGIIRGAGAGPNILLNGHMDVVDPGSLDAWAPLDPWTPVVEDGKLYGRGITDMLAGLITVFYTFKAVAEYLAKTGEKLSGDLCFTGVVQEEPACMFGIEYFCNNTMKEHDLKFDMAYIAEPSDNIFNNRQRGKVELVIKTFGKVAHSSTPEAGINALEFMNPIIENIFTKRGIKILKTPDYSGNITITNCIVRPGGVLSCIPDEVELCVDRRYTPDQTLEDLIEEFETMFRALECQYPNFKATVEPRVYHVKSWTGYEADVKKFHPGWETPADEGYLAQSIAAVKAIGHKAETGVCLAGTDCGMTKAILGIPSVLYGGGPGAQAHQPKEHIVIDGVNENLENYIAIMNSLFGINID